QPAPTLVLEQATIQLEDQLAPAGTPPLEIKNVSGTLLNDPLPTFTFAAQGVSDLTGPVSLKGQARRDGGWSLELSAATIPVGPTLIRHAAGCVPALATHLRQLRGAGEVKALVEYDPRRSPSLSWDCRLHLRDGEWSHARLPQPLQQLRF